LVFRMWAIRASPMLSFKSFRMSLARPSNASQTEILGDYFIRRYPYTPPSLTTIKNPLMSNDLTSRSSRSKTRRNQSVQQEIPSLSSKYVFHFFLIFDPYVHHSHVSSSLSIHPYPLQHSV
jgi:hypothetical protein